MTTDLLYLRLIGDRSIDERYFGKIKKDRTKEMQLWANILKDIQENEKNVKTSIIAANNHYAGFGPMTVQLFAEMMNLENHVRPFPLVDYKIPSSFSNDISIFQNNRIYNRDSKLKARQTNISEFFK